MSKTLTPSPYQVLLDEDGNPVSGGQIGTYLTGTTTPAATYADSEGTVENENPIVTDAYGRYIAYLTPGVAYRFTFLNADGSELYPLRDGIGAVGTAATPTSDNGIVQGRLTLEALTAVPASDITSAQTLYFTPYLGNAIALFDAVSMQWLLYTFSELSLSLTALSANTNYDIFALASGDQVSLASLAWASATARGTALEAHDGVLVRADDSTQRYLGTIRITAVAGRGEDSFAHRFVWNYYNRAPRPMRVVDATNTWSYQSSLRQANGNTANQLAFVVGVNEVPLIAEVQGFAAHSIDPASVVVAIGLDSTSAATSGNVGMRASSGAAALIAAPSARLSVFPGIGYHFAAWLEQGLNAGGATTWYGDDGGTTLQSGISGSIDG
jgi:hypothetical protein